MKTNIFFYILVRSWSAFENFEKCINSVFAQTYKNYKIIFVDDSSNYTIKQKGYVKERLKNHVCVFNKVRRYSLCNAYKMIHKFAEDDQAVVFNLDGDDWLLNDQALTTVASVYKKNPKCLLTYGECVLWNGVNISNKPSRFVLPNVNIPYSSRAVRENSYRLEPFYPLHPRTWKVWLFRKIRKNDFLRHDERWLQFAEDQAIFYPMLEMANGNFEVISTPLYVYNMTTEHSDIKENLSGLIRDELIIRKKPKYEAVF